MLTAGYLLTKFELFNTQRGGYFLFYIMINSLAGSKNYLTWIQVLILRLRGYYHTFRTGKFRNNLENKKCRNPTYGFEAELTTHYTSPNMLQYLNSHDSIL